MPAIVTVIDFTGNSGEIYSFDVYPIHEECLQGNGVYVFTERSLNSSTFKYEHNICLIGSAKFIPNKLYDQQKKHCIDQNAVNSVCYLALPAEIDRKMIEHDLLNVGNTLCNEAKGASFLLTP